VTLPRLLPVVLTAFATLATSPAGVRQSGSISGRVRLSNETPAPSRPAVSALSGSRRHAIDRRRSVVYLDAAPRQAFGELQPGRARMDQRGEQFVPHLLAITVGTVVEFPNSDSTFHNVFSLSRVKTFDLGRYPPGRTGAIVFDRPGVVPISCDIHTHMSAYVLVFSHPFFAITDEEGRYTIADVPAGTYQLDVWSELGRAAPLRITVADGQVTDANFAVGRTP